MSNQLRRAFRFFLANAGYATPPGRAQCALDLARAELRLLDSDDLEVITEDDDETAYCYCDDPKCPYHEGSDHEWQTLRMAIVRPCPEHGVNCRHTESLASLCGIMIDGDDSYLRVVRAELASEVFAHE